MKTRRIVAGLVLAASISVLAACGGPATDRGFVTDKSHQGAYTYVQQICSPAGKVPICTPVVHSQPEQWRIKVQDRDGDEAWLNVTVATYDGITVGQWYEPGAQR